ncbi:MAG: Uma2 family endonuclease [Proteobacteria bacterium]|nr:Uma2 family endonuclease [Pseudomonadota bacterium]
MSDMNHVTAPQPYLISVEQYHKMGAIGLFEPEARLELLEGAVLKMAPIGARHASAVAVLTEMMFRSGIGGRCFVWSQNPLQLLPMTELQPDLLLLRPRADNYREFAPRQADVLLLIEVSDSSLTFDRRRKVPLYARYDIPEVWLLNIPDRCLEVMREPGELGYGQTLIKTVGEPCAPLAFAHVSLAWHAALGRT